MIYVIMSIISVDIKEKIIKNIKDILNFKDENWINLNTDMKLKIIHHFCNELKNNNKLELCNKIIIPLKNIRPKKLIQLSGINKKYNLNIFDEYRAKILNYTVEFRNNYNLNKKIYCYKHIPLTKFNDILNKYNYIIYDFLIKNIDSIEHLKFFNDITLGNQQKIIYDLPKNKKEFKILKISYKDNYLYIDFTNNVQIKCELYLTSEKITRNIPAKYKISLLNIF